MIVFSATNEVTGDVFVGNTREGLEVEWAQLISQADEGASGKFFALIRRHGADSFEVEEYAYADSGAELRELTREARDELGAEAIKSARRSTSSVVGKKSMSMEAIMASIEEAAREAEAGMAPTSPSESAPSKAVQAVPTKTARTAPAVQLKTSATRASIVPAPAAPVDEPKIAAGRTGSASKEKRIREAIASEREARDQLRQTQSRDSQAEMNAVIARIEQRRAANKATGKKTTTKKSSASKTASAKTSAVSAGASKLSASSAGSVTAASKLAAGRTGSSAKEKRIKEAIALEKAEREAQQKAKAAAEADEMAAILARLDARSKDAEKIKRRR